MLEVVLLLHLVVGLERRGGNLDGVGENLMSVLDLLNWLLMDRSSCSIWVMAWADCVGSYTIPDPNCACAMVAGKMHNIAAR